MAKSTNSLSSEPRRGTEPADEAYLRLVGERVRLMRLQMGMSRKALSQASGVSERYLAELERGSGNASLLVLRNIADALDSQVHDLTVEEHAEAGGANGHPANFDSLDGPQAVRARQQLVNRLGISGLQNMPRIALIGLRGAGKTVLGTALAEAIQVPFVDLDSEVERVAGIDVSEVFAVHGEAVFQRLENQCLNNLLSTQPRGVINTGGGIVKSRDTFDQLLDGCFVVWVRASLDGVLAGQAGRMAGDEASKETMRQRLEDALAERTPYYEMADAIVDTTGRSLEEAVADVLDQAKLKSTRQQSDAA